MTLPLSHMSKVCYTSTTIFPTFRRTNKTRTKTEKITPQSLLFQLPGHAVAADSHPPTWCRRYHTERSAHSRTHRVWSSGAVAGRPAAWAAAGRGRVRAGPPGPAAPPPSPPAQSRVRPHSAAGLPTGAVPPGRTGHEYGNTTLNVCPGSPGWPPGCLPGQNRGEDQPRRTGTNRVGKHLAY